MSTGRIDMPDVTSSMTHPDPTPTPPALQARALPSVLTPPAALPAGRPDDTSSLTRPDMRRVEASRHLATQLLPDGVVVEQLAVQPGDGIIGAAARTALTTDPPAAVVSRGDVARLVRDRDRLAAEVARLRDGASVTTGDPHEVPTAAQAYAGLLSMDADGRLHTITTWGHDVEAGRRCRDLLHDARVADLERQLRDGQAREAALERELAQLRVVDEAERTPAQ